MAKSDPSEEKREPGFNSIPSPEPDSPSPTDAIDDIVGGIVDRIQEDATGEKPQMTKEQNNESKH